MLNGCTTVKLGFVCDMLFMFNRTILFLYLTRLNWQTIYNRPVKGRRQDSILKENSLFTDNANCLAFCYILCKRYVAFQG